MACPDTWPSMNLTSPAVISRLLATRHLRPKQSLGQHFLIDAGVLQPIIESADLQPGALSLEIGAGLGVLTRELAARSARVAAIEYDRTLAPILEETAGETGNVKIIQADAVRLLESTPIPDLFQESGEPFAVQARSVTCVSNLPYSITSPAIIGLLNQKRWLRSAVLMIQEEVAQRLAARPGTREYGAITVFARYHAKVEILMTVPAESFMPPPSVSSAVIRLTPLYDGAVPVRSVERLFAVSRALFGQRRKTCANALSSLPDRPTREAILEAIAATGIDPTARGETLSVEQIAALADRLPTIPT